jgi:predicted SAM-dependent methyltransferase
VRRLLLLLFSHRTLAVARWDLGLLGVRLRAALSGQRARIRRFVATRPRPVLLNLGAGPRGVDDAHWVNVDAAPGPGVRFLLDFCRPLPFDDASFDGVFCEHVLEHFGQEDGERLAREVARILRPGGVFRVIVPDAQYVLRSYFEAPGELVAARGGGEGTAMEMVNSYFRQRYEHQFMYDWETLSRMLRRAGFAEVVRSRRSDPAGCQGLRIDDPKYERESLYAEARTGTPRPQDAA